MAATSTDTPSGLPASPSSLEQSTSLPQRIAQYKQSAALHLANVQLQNIAKKCSRAQTILQKVKTKDITNAEIRRQTYTGLATQLNALIGRLERQNVDTAGLKSSQAKFNGSISQYLSDYESYKTALDDAVVMDCASDPAGFEAALIDARQLRSKLAKDSAQIKALVPSLAKDLSASRDALARSLTTKGIAQ